MATNIHDQTFGEVLRELVDAADNPQKWRATRSGYTVAVFPRMLTFDMKDGFPLLTKKFVPFKIILAELLWFIEGGRLTNYRMSTHRLNEMIGNAPTAHNIWTDDQARFASQGKAKFDGDCGVIYGSQWRHWEDGQGGHIDQLTNAVQLLRNDPFSRYIIVIAWNPAKIADMCLAPCHMKFQLFARLEDGVWYLDISMDQRSCDVFLGLSFNIASYALLLHMLAHLVGMKPGRLSMVLDDCHLYVAGKSPDGTPDTTRSHLEAAKQMLLNPSHPAPSLAINPKKAYAGVDDFEMGDFKLEDYQHSGKIPAPLLT